MTALLGPYELNTIATGDCAKLMTELPDDCIDLTVTSPPYDDLRSYNGYHFDFEAIAAQLWRVTKPGGVVVWVVSDNTVDGSETGTSFRQALHFMSLGFNLHDTMIYRNNPRWPDPTRYYSSFEYMFVFSKGQPSAINLIRDRKNRKAGKAIASSDRLPDGTIKQRSERNKYHAVGVRYNVWYIPAGMNISTKDGFAYEHPAMFPESLARDHIISWSNPGDIVLDPMCGSGTTCKMAHETGRQFLGFEISEEYTEIARRRVSYARTPLFAEVPR